MSVVYRFGKHVIDITNPEKVLFSKKITKADLVAYYAKIAPIMLPYLKDRPLSMLRYPNGITGESFFQKQTPTYFPSWIKRISIEHTTAGRKGEHTEYVVCNNAATLVYLANQACITMHVTLSKIDKQDYPDRLIFDLDPPDDKSFALVKETALGMRAVLASYKLPSYVMTTGSRGLHVLVPLKRLYTFDQVRNFARTCAETLAADNPKHLTLDIRKNKRGKRLFLDVLRNSFGHTAVAPYSVRAYPEAPVATPLEWNELDDRKLSSRLYTINNLEKRLHDVGGDLWKNIQKKAQKLPKI